jgi:YggT family protein
VLLLALQVAELIVLALVQTGAALPHGLGTTLVIAVAKLIDLVLTVYLVAIIVQAILSWVSSGYHPAASVLYSLTEPVLRPARNLLPPMGGLDLSPLLVIIAIQLLKMLLLPPLYQLAMQL